MNDTELVVILVILVPVVELMIDDKSTFQSIHVQYM